MSTMDEEYSLRAINVTRIDAILSREIRLNPDVDGMSNPIRQDTKIYDVKFITSSGNEFNCLLDIGALNTYITKLDRIGV